MKGFSRSDVLLVGAIAAIACSTPASAQGSGDSLRILQTGTVMRVTADTGQTTGELAQPFRPADRTPIVLIPCGHCTPVTYAQPSITNLEIRAGTSRGTHVGIGLLSGLAIGAAAGAVLGGTTEIEGSKLGATGAFVGGSILGVAGGIIGAIVGAVLPVHYHWERVPISR